MSGETQDEEAVDPAAEAALARDCAAGDAAALGRFEDAYLARVPRAVAHLGLSPTEIDEVRQHVRQKLLVERDDAGAPRIVGYAHDGRLRGLVKVIAVRAGVDLVRAKVRDAPGEGPLDLLPSPEADPELAFLKATYRAAFASAFGVATKTLSARQRNWLRLHVLDGVGLEEIARTYGSSRATVVRTLADTRAQLLAETRKELGRSLGLRPAELESIMELIASRLDASVARLLASTDRA